MDLDNMKLNIKIKALVCLKRHCSLKDFIIF